MKTQKLFKNNTQGGISFKGKVMILALLMCVSTLTISAQPYEVRKGLWVDSVLSHMTLDEKIGQIFMVRAFSKGDIHEQKIIEKFIKKYHIGGICFFQGSPQTQQKLVSTYQSQSKYPLLIAIDGEWGLGMRFPDKTISFPKAMTLGAISDNKLIYKLGREIAKQCKSVGTNLNFAPSIDVNCNPKNPVIFDRSFGEDVKNVTEKGFMLAKGMEDEGVMSCLKHFPGHGDTFIDSHKDLPTIHHSVDRLEETELYPFRRLATSHLGSIMVGHLYVPELDNTTLRPATLSDKIIGDLLRQDMGFDGLVVSDAMDMKGVTKYYASGIAEAEAFLAGNDIILLPENLPLAIQTIHKYISNGTLSIDRLDLSVKRILSSKYNLGLISNDYTELTENNSSFLDDKESLSIKQELFESAITLVTDHHEVIPFLNDENKSFASLAVNSSQITGFQRSLEMYGDYDHYNLLSQKLAQKDSKLFSSLSGYDHVVVGIHTSGKRNDYTAVITAELIEFLTALSKKTKVTVVHFGNPYMLKNMPRHIALVVAYENDPMVHTAASMALYGSTNISGSLPVSINDDWPYGTGLKRENIQRLGVSVPERLGMSSQVLAKIDTLMHEMISAGAAPGAQVLITKDSRIVFSGAYGHMTYSDQSEPIGNHTIYDLASVTKILSTTLATMKLYEKNKINLKNPLKKYLSGIDTTNKSDLLIEELLLHKAGLIPFIPFYKQTTRSSTSINPTYYSSILKKQYDIPVTERLFLRSDFKDSIWHQIYASELRTSKRYRYSDVGFYFLQRVIENLTNEDLSTYVKKHFYAPMGLYHTGYNPSQWYDTNNIAPTEYDTYFRFQKIQGYVHDMGAAMLGGVGGHAGLFSNSMDVAILMQMLLNNGTYGGKRFFNGETIQLFTQRPEENKRRSLGFDMKDLTRATPVNMSDLAPNETFGHMGFTGTAVWADPVHNIVFVFLCNRTYPNIENQKLNKLKTRQKVQDQIYMALKKYASSHA